MLPFFSESEESIRSRQLFVRLFFVGGRKKVAGEFFCLYSNCIKKKKVNEDFSSSNTFLFSVLLHVPSFYPSWDRVFFLLSIRFLSTWAALKRTFFPSYKVLQACGDKQKLAVETSVVVVVVRIEALGLRWWVRNAAAGAIRRTNLKTFPMSLRGFWRCVFSFS